MAQRLRDFKKASVSSAVHPFEMDKQPSFSDSALFSGCAFGDANRPTPPSLADSSHRATPSSCSTDQSSPSQSSSNSPPLLGHDTYLYGRPIAPTSNAVLELQDLGHAQSLASVGNNVNFNSLRPGLDVDRNTRAACHSVSSGPATTDAHSEFGATVLEGYPASLPIPVHNSSSGTHSCVAVRGSIRGYDWSEESEDGSSGYGRENDDDRAGQSGSGGGDGGDGDSGDNDGEEQNDRIARKTSHRNSRSVSLGPLNCPYHKRNKVRFNVREHWKCTKPFANLSNVKSVSADSAQPWPLFVCADYLFP
ncbi:hypothetical protein MYCTH_2301536 [Thermothelomyces thermophilus ATCC 42464]|uniref:Uncharacterized protein n=1 Tax=Thermothelomyces thermophilus (strain ATCC 42464 / BCRC 31852 / DSM 1799) TaxID=573729 RepID=G2Q9P4_THET4|nr:uncharacterized protein MYCTH_2301536 [Thermothelomyces thermophilus ATCC 42464]AEO56503.1 hypothetical protein MYCTH_2301536 [Thermothelomyces thermophilus ATCC 42464]